MSCRVTAGSLDSSISLAAGKGSALTVGSKGLRGEGFAARYVYFGDPFLGEFAPEAADRRDTRFLMVSRFCSFMRRRSLSALYWSITVSRIANLSSRVGGF